LATDQPTAEAAQHSLGGFGAFVAVFPVLVSIAVAAVRRVDDSSYEPDRRRNTMRKITAELFSTLDGIVSGPQHWHGPYFSEEAGRQTEESLANSDLMLLGANTYDEHAGYWPTADGRMAELMNGIAKLVVTSRSEPLEWSNSTRLSGEVEASVSELKQQDGGPSSSPAASPW
jgi:hypothetical protein